MAIRQHTLRPEQWKGRSAEDLLREVAEHDEELQVVLEDGRTIQIRLEPALKPLLTLTGSVPDGWKDAIDQHRSETWEQEIAFARHLLAQGPVEGGRAWTREELYDR